jgi:hypothetical protein
LVLAAVPSGDRHQQQELLERLGSDACSAATTARLGVTWSTFGPHAIGAERFVAVSSGASFAQVAAAILGKRASV